MSGRAGWFRLRWLSFGRGPVGWTVSVLMAMFTVLLLVLVFMAWRIDRAPVSLSFAIPAIEAALSPSDGPFRVRLGQFFLRRTGLQFAFEAQDLTLYRLEEDGKERVIAELPVARIDLSVAALVDDGLLAPERIEADGLLVKAERGEQGVELSFTETEGEGEDARLSLRALRQLLRDDPRLRYLRTIVLSELTFRVHDPELDIAWQTERTSMRIVNSPSAIVWSGTAGIVAHRGELINEVDQAGTARWTVTLPIVPADGARDVMVDDQANLLVQFYAIEPDVFLDLLPGISASLAWQGEVSGTVATHFSLRELPESVHFDLQATSGRIGLVGSAGGLPFDHAWLSGRMRLRDRQLEIDDLTVEHAGHTARVQGKGGLSSDDHFAVDMTARGVYLPWLSQLAPAFPEAGYADLTASAEISAKFGQEGSLEDAAIRIQSDGGTLTMPDDVLAPLKIGNIGLDIQVDHDGEIVQLRRLNIELPRTGEDGAVAIALEGAAERGGEGVFQVVSGDLKLSDLKRLWPKGVGEGARVWIVDQVHEGFVPEFVAEVRMRFPDAAQWTEPEALTVDGRMPLRGVALTYWGPLPRATKMDADARITEKLFEAKVLRGESAGMRVKGGHVAFTGIDKGKGYERTTLYFDLEGPVRNLMSVLDREPLGFAKFLELPPDQLAGEISGRLKASFPPIEELSIDDIDISATGRTRAITIPDAAFGQDLRDGAFQFSVDKSALKLDGSASLVGQPADIDVDLRFNTRAPYRSKISLTATVDEAARAALGFAEFPFSPEEVSGPVAVALVATEAFNGTTRIDVNADLSAARLSIPALGRLPEGKASATASVLVDAGVLRGVDAFEVLAPETRIAGAASWRAKDNGRPMVTISRLEHGEGTSLAIAADPRPAGGYRLTLRGSRLDARSVFREVRSSGDEAESAASGAVPISIDLDIGAITVASGAPLRNVSGELQLLDGKVRGFTLQAVQPDGGLIRGAMGIGGQLVLESSNLGAFAETLAVTDRIQGGHLTIEGTRDAETGQIKGRIQVTDPVLEEAPFLVRLLSGGSVDTPKVEHVWDINIADADFELTKGLLTLSNGRVAGGELGISYRGWIDLDREKLDLAGEIAPGRSVNRLLREIPLIGKVLTGDSGLFAATYRATGSLAEPNFKVDPLTALAPGIVRRLFDQEPSPPPAPAQ